MLLFTLAMVTINIHTARAQWTYNGYWQQLYNGDTLLFEVNLGQQTAMLKVVALQSTTNNLHIPSNITVTEEETYEDDYGESHTVIRNINYVVNEICDDLEFFVNGEPFQTGHYNSGWHYPADTVTIPSSVTSGEIGAENIVFAGTLTEWNNSTIIGTNVNGYNLYINGMLVTDLTIPSDWDTIHRGAFQYCKSIQSVTIPNTLTYVDHDAFNYCFNLKSVTIDPGSYIFGVDVFGADHYPVPYGIQEIHFNGTLEQWASRNWKQAGFETNHDYGANDIMLKGYYECDTLDDGTLDDWNYHEKGYKLYIGNDLLTDCHLTTDTIRPYAFYNCASISSLTISTSVKAIFHSALEFFSGLNTLSLPQQVPTLILYDQIAPTDNLYRLFGGGTNTLSRVNYNGTLEEWIQSSWPTKINAFYTIRTLAGARDTSTIALYINGTLLEDCTLPTTVTAVPDYAFTACSIRRLTIPNNIDTIGNYAFALCNNLEGTLEIDHAGIGPWAFANCRKLSGLIIGDGVHTIENAAFCYDSLMSITIGASVDSIGSVAFACHLPEKITVLGSTPARLGRHSFGDDGTTMDYMGRTTVALQVPCGAYDNYASSAWSEMFSNITEVENVLKVEAADLVFGLDEVHIVAGYVEIVHGATCSNDEVTIKATGRTIYGHNFRFDHWSDGSRENPYSFSLTSDTTMTAYFAEGAAGIDEEPQDGIKAYASNGQIVVLGADGQSVCLYDMGGRLLDVKHCTSEALHFDVPSLGVYIIKVDGMAAKKVVVAK